jgi:sec-independent protein translocase protein TatC
LKQFKIAVLLIFITAAVVTPTGDPMTLMIFAAPMIGLYLLSIAIAFIVGPKRLKGTDSAEGA